jgi:hypothetical protein
LSLFNQINPSRSNNEPTNHFPVLAWCRDEQLRLIDMDATFRQTWHDYTRTEITRTKIRNLFESTIISKSSSSLNSRQQQQQGNRSDTNKITMDIIEDELTDVGESDLDDSAFPETSSPRINSIESSENGDEHDISIT